MYHLKEWTKIIFYFVNTSIVTAALSFNVTKKKEKLEKIDLFAHAFSFTVGYDYYISISWVPCRTNSFISVSYMTVAGLFFTHFFCAYMSNIILSMRMFLYVYAMLSVFFLYIVNEWTTKHAAVLFSSSSFFR